MPLSDNEQRLLEQMERALYAEDPKFASTMRGASRRPGAGRRFAVGGAGFAVGVIVLLVGVMQQQVVVGALGFVLMLASTAFAVSHRRTGPAGVVSQDGTVRQTGSRRRRGGASFMQRLEQRWDRRRDEG
ncbi:MAG: DUF3040 domain-containing protein [Actinomycetales bacterium]|nr:DUF3040 domain-containing protein [Actinomycetales bacterium]